MGGIYAVMPLSQEIAADSQRALIEQAALGSGNALATLFELHSAMVHRVAYRLMMSADDAEDIVQDVFVGLPEALGAYSGSGSFAAWLRAITVRVALMRLRSGRRRDAAAARAKTEIPSARADAAMDRISIADALRELSGDLRVVFMLADIEGYSHAEIASLLGIRPGTSEVRLHRARRTLRALLKDR